MIVGKKGGESLSKTEQLIFFDFEMLCTREKMTFSEMESIRLGAVKYNLKTKEIKRFDRFIKPLNKKPLSRFCRVLTGINNNDLANALSFGSVFNEFLHWVGDIKVSRFFSWGLTDIERLKIDCHTHGISSEIVKKVEKRYVDFQRYFAIHVSKNIKSVENALLLYDESFEGKKHHPTDDSYNTLRIYLLYQNDFVKSDLAMIKSFVFDNISDIQLTKFNANEHLHDSIRSDFLFFESRLNIVDEKFLKQAQKAAFKYRGIIKNRSGLFTDENISLCLSFYHSVCQVVREYENEYFIHQKRTVL